MGTGEDQLQAKADEHWSSSPKVQIVEDAAGAEVGAPPGPEDTPADV